MPGVRPLLFTLAALAFQTGCEPAISDAPAASARSARRRTPAEYLRLKRAVERERQRLGRRWQRAGPGKARRRVLERARGFLVQTVARRLLPFWYGTRWAFHGTTETPGQGRIACGYLVTTVLRDAGFRVQRARLARQASERIIQSLVAEAYIRRFSNTPLKDFVASVRAMGEGLFLVGLDNHVGFLLVRRSQIFFVHASYVAPGRVVREPAHSSKVLGSSRYRVVGRLCASDDLVRAWLAGRRLRTIATR